MRGCTFPYPLPAREGLGQGGAPHIPRREDVVCAVMSALEEHCRTTPEYPDFPSGVIAAV